MAKIFYYFDISESENGFLVFENDKLQHTVGLLSNRTELELWLEDHASIRGLGPENYSLNFLPKPLKSREIIDRTLDLCENSFPFNGLGVDMPSLHIISNHVVDLRKLKSELETTQYTGENCNAIDSCLSILKYSIEQWEGMIRYIAKQYIL